MIAMGAGLKKRGRALGLPFSGETGVYNAITDVPGVEVGFKTITKNKGEGDPRPGVQTGVTAILPRGRAASPAYLYAGMHSLNGNGEMTGSHWINDAGYFVSPICITNTHSVGVVHHGVLKWMIDRYPDFFSEQHNFVMPVVAETYDGVLNDINGLHITEADVIDALDAARPGQVAEGNVGGGNGMIAYEFKGGTGVSSQLFEIGARQYALGVLVQSNFGKRSDLVVCGAPVGELMPEDAIYDEILRREMGSVIVVIATDAPLIPSQLSRVAKRASLGIARTGALAANGSGDIFLAFSTANEAVDLSKISAVRQITAVEDEYLDEVYRAARDAVEEAIINALLAAETSLSVNPAGLTAHAIDHDRLMNLMKSRLNT